MFSPCVTIGQNQDGEWAIEYHSGMECGHEECGATMSGHQILMVAKLAKTLQEGLFTALASDKQGGC